MATERTRRIALAVLLVLLTFVLYSAVTSLNKSSATSTGSTSNTRARTARSAATPGSAAAPDVHLRTLDDERPKPLSGERNLFRFKPKPPPAPPRAAAPPPTAPIAPAAPAGPPPLPPIPLKFIGIVEAPHSKLIAALVDTTGHSFHGREGEVVAGQYRIVKIGVESIEMTYLDGRGRQTIRLTGS